jgi:hypothetical protein
MKDKTGTSKGSKEPNLEEILEEIRRKPTVKVWPHAGRALGYGRGATYAAAARNEIDVIRLGRKMKAVSASLRRRLGLEGSHQ